MSKVARLDQLAKALGLARLPLDVVESLETSNGELPRTARGAMMRTSRRPLQNEPRGTSGGTAAQRMSGHHAASRHKGQTLPIEQRLRAALVILVHHGRFGSHEALARRAWQSFDRDLGHMSADELDSWLQTLTNDERKIVLSRLLAES